MALRSWWPAPRPCRRHQDDAMQQCSRHHHRQRAQPAQQQRRCRPPRAQQQQQQGGLLSQLFGRLGGATPQPQLQDCEPRLREWLQQRGYAVEHERVVAQQLEGQGRGLVANSAVPRGQLLLAVPSALVVFPETAASGSLLAPLLAQGAKQLPDWSVLALFLAEQLYRLEWRGDVASGQSSSATSTSRSTGWGPYVEVLPRSPIGTVLDWTSEEVEGLLAGSGLLVKARSIRAAAEALWRDLQPLIAAAKAQHLCPQDMFSQRDVSWAVGVCLSRSVRLDDMPGEPIVLVPFADLANHDPASEAFLVWDQQLQAVVLRPDRSYRPGEQVFISYGPKSSGELLLSYGFCPSPGTNPHDAAHLTFSLPSDDPWHDAKVAAMAARAIPTSEMFSVRIDSLPAGLVPYLAFCAAPAQSSSEVDSLACELFDKGLLPDVGGVSTERLALEALARHCRDALKAYPQSQEADRRAAVSAVSGGGFEQRRALTAAIRTRERQILSRTEFIAQQRARELRRRG